MSEQGEYIQRGIMELGERNAALTAENARLRGEVEELRAAKHRIATVYAERRRIEREKDDHVAALTADLARVTAERDGLFRAAERVRLTVFETYELPGCEQYPGCVDGCDDCATAKELLLAMDACADAAALREAVNRV
jgi:hypothetical protein